MLKLNKLTEHMPMQVKTSVMTSPILKWVGGKGQLLEQFATLFPEKSSYNRYLEPFFGGGAVFFHLQPGHAVISDLNADLINVYKVVQSSPESLITVLERHQEKHNKEYYYAVREAYNERSLEAVEAAAAFIYLNKTCFNGLYRVNKKGGFNVPFGSHQQFSFDENNILNVHSLLQNVSIKREPFYHVLEYAQKGDFIYFDPPYYPLSKSSNFTSYTNEGFLEKEQEELTAVFKQLDKRGCKVMLSNSDTEFIKNLYKGYIITTVYAKRFINSRAEGRGAITEIVVRNYT